MTKLFNIVDYDVIFLSYDEPNADDNYRRLLEIIPHAKRVHGVYGSDAAHKAAAEASSTKRFIVIDGDNVLDNDSFLDQTVELFTDDDSNVVFSWPSKNIINGLVYGNGGIKCWPKKTVLNMKTHENADLSNTKAQVDFCWEFNYMTVGKSYSTTVNNSTPLQAWRAGFREGVKMSLVNGSRPTSINDIADSNLKRLLVWSTVGVDVDNGIWAIYGARLGCYMTLLTDWDYIQVRDFAYLNSLWDTKVKSLSNDELNNHIAELGKKLETLFSVPELFSVEQSKLVKKLSSPQILQHKDMCVHNTTLYDIVMITYKEPNADKNWELLKKDFPRAKRVDNVTGIHNAHKMAAKISSTKFFWVVDGDAIIDKKFKFDFVVEDNSDSVRVWRSRNPVNGLVYGYGGIKLLPRTATLLMDPFSVDMTTSISKSYIPVLEVSNISEFNVDEFSTWRSAFRECAKLSSKIVDRQHEDETTYRLNVWCTIGADKPFGRYCIDGANLGRKFGEENKGNSSMLSKINNFDWLRNKFNEQY